MLWALLLPGLLLAILVAIGWYFSDVVLYPKTFSAAACYNYEFKQGRMPSDGFPSWPQEEMWIDSPHGYPLYGAYLPLRGAKRTVIIAHGITATLYSSVRYATLFRALGFNLLLIEHRNHGRSGGAFTSYGVYEKDDLKAWVDWALERCPDCAIGVHGESMGAATALQHAAIDDRLAFVVADCPFANARDEFTYRLKEEHGLPAFPIIPTASLITRVRAGWFFGDAAPIAQIAGVKTPVLFIHGADDAYIPPEASVALHAAKRGVKQLYLAPGADHAQAYQADPEAYEAVVREFLEATGVL
ncbi:MAG: alpha/beta hydrolase [Anaerolineae bacterium]